MKGWLQALAISIGKIAFALFAIFCENILLCSSESFRGIPLRDPMVDVIAGFSPDLSRWFQASQELVGEN